ncbi:hypothetical protein MTO96_037934 [Rhipicephalus appendiculatus]
MLLNAAVESNRVSMSTTSGLGLTDTVVFGILTAAGYIIGLYFSFTRGRQIEGSPGDGSGAEQEAFLGGRSLPSYALAVSLVASVANAVSVVGFVGHYFAHGFHFMWPSAVFPIPMLYSNIAIGLAGTIYTALGGLRSVVWADCAQAFVMFASPFIIIGKIIYDSYSVNPPLRPILDINVTDYAFRTNLDFTTDENMWSGLAGALPFSLVRTVFDQMAVQRFMAAKTLRQAQGISVVGPLFVLCFFTLGAMTGIAVIYWYRDCNPVLSGVIKSFDQIVPHYMKERLSEVTALRGLFLAGLVGASTSLKNMWQRKATADSNRSTKKNASFLATSFRRCSAPIYLLMDQLYSENLELCKKEARYV